MKNEVLTDVTNIEPARFIHDCDVCKYLGRHEEYDLYFCKTEPTVIARFSSEGSKYMSGMEFANSGGSRPLYEAKKLAIKQGLLRETTAEKLGSMTVKYELANKQRDRFEAECDRLREIIIMNGLADQLIQK